MIIRQVQKISATAVIKWLQFCSVSYFRNTLSKANPYIRVQVSWMSKTFKVVQVLFFLKPRNIHTYITSSNIFIYNYFS